MSISMRPYRFACDQKNGDSTRLSDEVSRFAQSSSERMRCINKVLTNSLN